MILKQYYLGCLAHASYLLGDEVSSTAIVVDPQRDIEQYLADADKLGLQIRHVFLTHFHADFIAGHLELRDRCGATIYLARCPLANSPASRTSSSCAPASPMRSTSSSATGRRTLSMFWSRVIRSRVFSMAS